MNDWLDFFSSVIGSLSWPAAVAVIVYLLRREIRGLLASMQRLKFRDLEIEFREQVQALEQRAKEERLPLGPAKDDLTLLAEASPRGLVLESWLIVVDEARKAAKRAGIHVRAGAMPSRIFDELESGAKVTKAVRWMMEDLRDLRNLVIHSTDFGISPTEALEYAQVSRRIAAVLRAIDPSGEGE